MSNNPCADAVTSPYPAGPTTSQTFAQLTTNLATNNSKAVVQALKAMNIGQCTYTTTTQAAGVCSVDLGGCGAEASASQHAVGCSQISLQASLNTDLNSNISCALDQLTNSVTNLTNQTNNITIMIQNSSTGAIIINTNQVNIVKGTVYDFSSQQVQSAISSSIGNTVSNFSNSVQGTKNAAFSNPQSQKSISDQVNAIQNMVNSDAISQIVQTTCNNIVQNNGLTIVINTVNATSIGLDLQQLNLNDYVIQSIVTNFMAATFNNSIANTIQNTASSSQTQQNSGLIAGFGGLLTVIVIIIFLVLLFKFLGGSSLSSNVNGKCSSGSLIKFSYLFSFLLFIAGIIILFIHISSLKMYGIIGIIIGFIIFISTMVISKKSHNNCLASQQKVLISQNPSKTNQQSSNPTLNQHSSNPTLNQQSSNPTLNKKQQHSSNPTLNKNQQHSSNPTLNKKQQHSSNPTLNKKQQHSSNPTLNQKQQQSS